MLNEKKDLLQIVYIEGIDKDKKMIHAISKNGGRIAIPFQLANGVVRIPKVGEAWVARRLDNSSW